jgi:hypothetical protein
VFPLGMYFAMAVEIGQPSLFTVSLVFFWMRWPRGSSSSSPGCCSCHARCC